jgi:hypothetical protein
MIVIPQNGDTRNWNQVSLIQNGLDQATVRLQMTFVFVVVMLHGGGSVGGCGRIAQQQLLSLQQMQQVVSKYHHVTTRMVIANATRIRGPFDMGNASESTGA